MIEVKGINGGHLKVVDHKDFPDKVMVVVSVYGGETGEVFSRAELIQAINPEGTADLEKYKRALEKMLPLVSCDDCPVSKQVCMSGDCEDVMRDWALSEAK